MEITTIRGIILGIIVMLGCFGPELINKITKH